MSIAIDCELALLARAIANRPTGGSVPPLPDVDWARFASLVRRHRVAALVAESAIGLGLPGELVQELNEAEKANAAAFLRSKALLRTLEGAFATDGIDWAVLKGPVIAERYYPRPSLREMIDLDLLVDADRIDAAESVLLGEGFARFHPRGDLSEAQRRNFRAMNSAYSYFRKRDGAQLDLHWRTVQNPCLLAKIDAQWRELVVDAGKGAIRTLREDIHFAYVLAHGAKHGWARLKWLADAERMLHALSLQDAQRLATTLSVHDLEALAGSAFALCRTLFGTSLPDCLAKLADARRATRLHDLGLRLIVSDLPENGARPGDLRFLAIRIRHSLGLSRVRGYRRQAMLRELARQDDIADVALPAGWVGLLAIVSPLRVIGKALLLGR